MKTNPLRLWINALNPVPLIKPIWIYNNSPDKSFTGIHLDKQNEFTGLFDIQIAQDNTGAPGIFSYDKSIATQLNPGSSLRAWVRVQNGTLVNIFPNSGSESSANIDSLGDYLVDRTKQIPPHSGKWCLKHQWDNSISPYTRLGGSGFTFPSAGEWTISMFVWIPNLWDGGQASITDDNTYGGNDIISNRIDSNLSLRDQWQRISVTYNLDGADLSGAIVYRVTDNPTSQSKGIIYTDDIQIEPGDKVTRHSLSPYYNNNTNLRLRANRNNEGIDTWEYGADISLAKTRKYQTKMFPSYSPVIGAEIEIDEQGGEVDYLAVSNNNGNNWQDITDAYKRYNTITQFDTKGSELVLRAELSNVAINQIKIIPYYKF